MRKRLSSLRKGSSKRCRERGNRLRWASGSNFVGCLLCGAYSNHSSHANVNVAVKVSMKCSMKIKCARNKSAKREKKIHQQQAKERAREASKAVWLGNKVVPGKAKDLRKATTLHKSLLPLAAFVIENVAYMEMPWQNIFLLLQLIPLLLVLLLLLLLLFHFPRLLYARLVYFLFPLVFVLLIRRKSATQVPPSVDLSLAHPHSFSHYLYGCLFPACVCVLELSGVCQFISVSIQFFASLGSQLSFIGDAGFSFVCSIVLKFPSRCQVLASTLSYKN